MRWPNDLADTLRLHAMWRRGEAGGKRAYLARANLADASLAGADLEGARGNMREIKSMHAERWPVAWTMRPNGESWLQIGCQSYPVEKWRRGCDRWIGQMDENALDWWTRWKAPLLAVVDASPATPWGDAE